MSRAGSLVQCRLPCLVGSVLSIFAISAAGYAWSETTAAAPTSASAREAAVAALKSEYEGWS
jgi:hypothetical protein